SLDLLRLESEFREVFQQLAQVASPSAQKLRRQAGERAEQPASSGCLGRRLEAIEEVGGVRDRRPDLVKGLRAKLLPEEVQDGPQSLVDHVHRQSGLGRYGIRGVGHLEVSCCGRAY